MSGMVIVAIILMIAALLAGIPVPFALFAAALIIVLTGGYDYLELMQHGYLETGAVILISILLLLLAGNIMEKCGVGEALSDLADSLFGKMKGGMYLAAAAACAVFTPVSGRGSAVLARIGSRTLPKMRSAGYSGGVSAALISNASMMGVMLPPSISILLYAFAGGQSIAACFLAAVIPGIILMLLLALVTMFMARKEPRLPEGSDTEISGEESQEDEESQEEEYERSALPAILLPIIILVCIFTGIMTLTEAAAAALIYAIILGRFFYRDLDGSTLKECFIQSGTEAGAILITLFSAMILARVLAMENVPQIITEGLLSISDNSAVLLIFVILPLIIMGVLMDEISGILLAAPIMVPVVISMGINPVHFAAVAVISLGMGCMIPPCSRFLHSGAKTADVPVKAMMKPMWLLIAFAWLPTLIITAYIPQIALFLPSLFGYV